MTITHDALGPELTLAQVPQHRDDLHPDALLAQMHLPENDLAQDAPGPEVTFDQRGPCPKMTLMQTPSLPMMPPGLKGTSPSLPLPNTPLSRCYCPNSRAWRCPHQEALAER